MLPYRKTTNVFISFAQHTSRQLSVIVRSAIQFIPSIDVYNPLFAIATNKFNSAHHIDLTKFTESLDVDNNQFEEDNLLIIYVLLGILYLLFKLIKFKLLVCSEP